MQKKLWLCVLMLLGGCTTTPKGIQPVTNFQLERYLGTWYEIARLDHRFERGLQQVSATYSVRSDGGIAVLNRGFDTRKGIWKDATGRAYFTGPREVASLRVSFFWPFYGGYNVIELDDNYQYALVCGPSRDYLWILARARQLDEPIVRQLTATAQRLGFATSSLIYVDH